MFEVPVHFYSVSPEQVKRTTVFDGLRSMATIRGESLEAPIHAVSGPGRRVAASVALSHHPMNSTRVLIVPAAGRGLRLGASVPKVLVPVNGRPMLHHLLDLYAGFVGRVIVVAAPDARDAVTAAAQATTFEADVATQSIPTGMLDAISIGIAAAVDRAPGRVWITWGDQVGVQAGTLQRLAGSRPARTSHYRPYRVTSRTSRLSGIRSARSCVCSSVARAT